MISFLLRRQPKSYNSPKYKGSGKARYTEELRSALEHFYSEYPTFTGELYGIIYYFTKKKTQTDADNISKPVWDCLKDFLFDDDIQIKLRIAGVVDNYQEEFINLIDFSKIRENLMEELLEALKQSEHVMYIECGNLHHSMYKLNWEENDEN